MATSDVMERVRFVPQERGEVPAHLVERLAAASKSIEKARERRDRLIVQALKEGASSRLVAQAVGMSRTQVAAIGHAHGWPTEEQKLAREAKRLHGQFDRRQINDLIARYLSETADNAEPSDD